MIRSGSRAVLFGTCVVGAALVCAGPVRAETICAVELHSEAPKGDWSRAVRHVRAAMNDCGRHCDCGSVDVVADRAGATVLFVTRDGRRATRRIQSPGELGAVVEALSIDDDAGTTTDDAPAPAPPTPHASAALPPAGDLSSPLTDEWPRDEPPPAPLAPKKARVQVSLGAVGGARLAWPGNFASPIFRGSVGLAFARWEATAFVGLEPSYSELSIERERGMSAVGGGVTLGRRDPVGRVTLVYGISVSAYGVEERAKVESGPQKSHVSDSATELRLGLYGGVLVPITSGTRLRLQLLAEGSPASHVPSDDTLAAFPSAGLAGALGMDVDLP